MTSLNVLKWIQEIMFPSVFDGLRLIFFKNRTVLHYKSSDFPNFHYHYTI